MSGLVFSARVAMMRAMPNANPNASNAAAFAGFDDFIEVFRAGTHTDSNGQTRAFTEADLDQVVANFDAEHPAPAVVGHPKHDDPAYGWVAELKRAGKKLLAKFAQVEPQFAGMVKSGRFRNRSVKLVSSDKGWALAHVGFLGAAAPAVAGLKPIQFDGAAAGVVVEFAAYDAWSLRQIARGFRNLRDFILAQFGQEKADQAMPAYQIESLESAAAELEAQPSPPSAPLPRIAGGGAFNASTERVMPDPVVTFTQAQLDAAVTRARDEAQAQATQAQQRVRDLEFAQRIGAARTEVQAHVDAGRLSPAQAEGVAEFLAGLDAGAEFEFTAADKSTKKEKPAAFMRAFLAKLPKQVQLGREQAGADAQPHDEASFTAPAGYAVDPQKLARHEKALAYMREHKTTDYTAAIKAVSQA